MRSVVIVGYPGVQALDVVRPFEAFTTAARFLNDEGDTSEGGTTSSWHPRQAPQSPPEPV